LRRCSPRLVPSPRYFAELTWPLPPGVRMHREARSAKSRQQRRSRRNHGRFVAILKLTNQVQGVPQSATISKPKRRGKKSNRAGAGVFWPGVGRFRRLQRQNVSGKSRAAGSNAGNTKPRFQASHIKIWPRLANAARRKQLRRRRRGCLPTPRWRSCVKRRAHAAAAICGNARRKRFLERASVKRG